MFPLCQDAMMSQCSPVFSTQPMTPMAPMPTNTPGFSQNVEQQLRFQLHRQLMLQKYAHMSAINAASRASAMAQLNPAFLYSMQQQQAQLSGANNYSVPQNYPQFNINNMNMNMNMNNINSNPVSSSWQRLQVLQQQQQTPPQNYPKPKEYTTTVTMAKEVQIPPPMYKSTSAESTNSMSTSALTMPEVITDVEATDILRSLAQSSNDDDPDEEPVPFQLAAPKPRRASVKTEPLRSSNDDEPSHGKRASLSLFQTKRNKSVLKRRKTMGSSSGYSGSVSSNSEFGDEKKEKDEHSERRFNCPECTSSFLRSGDLSKHRRVHTGLRPYRCGQCGYSFAWSGDLTRHLRIHTGVRPYKCDVCNKTFTRSSHRNTHAKIHAREQYSD